MTIEIQPEWLWRYDRLKQLSRAISDRVNHDREGLYIATASPTEWFTEYGNHIKWMSENKPEQLIEFICK